MAWGVERVAEVEEAILHWSGKIQDELTTPTRSNLPIFIM